MGTMTVVVPEEMIAERQRLGLDLRDEVWDGVYHVVPPASGEHQRIGARLLIALAPAAEAAGLEFQYETGVFDPAGPPLRDYCVPDLVAFRHEVAIPAGVNGAAELVIEIRSPGDDSVLKVPFYSRVGVRELVVVERDTKLVRHWLAKGAELVEVAAGADGWYTLRAVPARVRAAGGRLQVATASASVAI